MTNESNHFTPRELIQIVPTLPPLIGGISDYALLLARELRDSHGVGTYFVTGDHTWKSPELVTPFVSRAVAERSAEALTDCLWRAMSRSGTILLHYVGHGYARRGCPFWLVSALERWKRQHSENRLILLFHELYASGPMWSSAFWSLPLQKSLVRRLARIGDLFLTPTSIASRLLQPLLPDRERTVKVLPVFSTLGEPAGVLPTAQRLRQMVVFGSLQWRIQAYAQHGSSLVEACRKMEIESIVDVGPTNKIIPNLLIPVRIMGAMPADEASSLFAESLGGFFSYPIFVLGKSTIFAAYCAHGMVPVTYAGNAESREEGLQEGVEYLTSDDASLTAPSKLAETAASALNWYTGHKRKAHAREISDWV